METKLTITEAMKTALLTGAASAAQGGPVVHRKKKPSYVKFDGIRVEKLGSSLRIFIINGSLDIGYYDGPLGMIDGETLTIQGDAIQGRSPFMLV